MSDYESDIDLEEQALVPRRRDDRNKGASKENEIGGTLSSQSKSFFSLQFACF